MVRVKGNSTTKKNTKKTVKKSEVVKVDTSDVNIREIEGFEYDPQKELDDLNNSLEVDMEIKLPDVVNETIEELKKSKDLSTNVDNGAYNKDNLTKLNEKIDKLSALEAMLEKDINERINKLTDSQKKRMDNMSTSFWGGILNNW